LGEEQEHKNAPNEMGKGEVPVEGESVEIRGAAIEQRGEEECADGGEYGGDDADPEGESERSPEFSARCALPADEVLVGSETEFLFADDGEVAEALHQPVEEAGTEEERQDEEGGGEGAFEFQVEGLRLEG